MDCCGVRSPRSIRAARRRRSDLGHRIPGLLDVEGSPPCGSPAGMTMEATHHDYIDPRFYDLAYAWYRDDVDYYVRAAREAGGPVLEVACGTGRILIPML